MHPRNTDHEIVFEIGAPHPFELLRESMPKENKSKQLALPKKVNFDEVNNRTILHWNDGTKTVVVRCKDNKHNRKIAFLTAYFQKHCGLSKTKANEYLAKLEEGEVKE